MNNSILTQAQQILFATADIDLSIIENTLAMLKNSKLDYADFYFQLSYTENFKLINHLIKSDGYFINKGLGVRAIRDETVGFAYADEISLSGLKKATEIAKSVAKLNKDGDRFKTRLCRGRENTHERCPHPALYYPSVNPIHTTSDAEKIAFLKKLLEKKSTLDPRITKLEGSIASQYEVILVLTTDGILAADIRPMTQIHITVQAEKSGKFERGQASYGERSDGKKLLTEERQDILIAQACHQALVNLEAIPAPAGCMPVILKNGASGVLLHEAVGHGLEGDFNRSQRSIFTGKLHQKIASALCTIVDNATLPILPGSLAIDDEGTPGQSTVLVENGRLTHYLLDKHNARLMGLPYTGNARRESYAHLPFPRMTNTYMQAGNDCPEDIIKSVPYGLYAVDFSGGQVDITSGKFVFTTSLAYLIEQGKITRPVKKATLIGDALTVLNNISQVGHDLTLDTGVGMCHKNGQAVPVGVGQPTVKIDRMTIGGTAL